MIFLFSFLKLTVILSFTHNSCSRTIPYCLCFLFFSFFFFLFLFPNLKTLKKNALNAKNENTVPSQFSVSPTGREKKCNMMSQGRQIESCVSKIGCGKRDKVQEGDRPFVCFFFLLFLKFLFFVIWVKRRRVKGRGRIR